ncbi:hypothetical protein SUGI_0674640 [Cryptomeria japonica]|nr:hypothetical protein SUGI_0674640 [Cryptomeria japonica]
MIRRTLCEDKQSWQLKRLHSLLRENRAVGIDEQAHKSNFEYLEELVDENHKIVSSSTRPELEDERDVMERDVRSDGGMVVLLATKKSLQSSLDTYLFIPITASVFPLLADIKLANMDAFTKVVKFIKIARRSNHKTELLAWLEENNRRRWQTKGGADRFICNGGILASSFDDRDTWAHIKILDGIKRTTDRVVLITGREEVGCCGGYGGFGECSNPKDGLSTLPNRKESAMLDTDTSIPHSKIDNIVDDLVAKDIGANFNFSYKQRKTSPLDSGGGDELVEMIVDKGVLELQFLGIVTKAKNFDADATTNVVTAQALLSFEEAASNLIFG